MGPSRVRYATKNYPYTKQLLRDFELRPKKGLGQNFLVNGRVLRKIVEAADLTSDDIVLEVGPGLGGLTRLLAERAGKVIAVELDERFVKALKDLLADLENVTIIHGDILKLTPSQFAPCPHYKVVANLPYYITSAVLRHFLEAKEKPELMVVTVQKEVAQRIVAKPGKMSLLSVSVQFYGRPRIVTYIPADAFYPPPKVDSAVVRIDVYERPLAEDEKGFFDVVRAGFSQRRKQLRNSLSVGLCISVEDVEKALRQAGIDPKRRAQSLSMEEWDRVHRALTPTNPPPL
jgi:16S rRNA (adenine1518-N6/adenine1519-N6)-dimethyltransferase